MLDDNAFKDPRQDLRLFLWRLIVAMCVVLLLAGGLVWRYYHLQMVRHHDFVTRSDRNRIQVLPVPPTRGLIFDRNGELLAYNRSSFNLMVVREQTADLDQTLSYLRNIVELSNTDIDRFRRQLERRQRPYEPVPLKFNLSEEEHAAVAINEYHLPGVQVVAEPVRHYPHGELFSHVIGYVGRINDRELAEIDGRAYSGTHVIGKTGVERSYEEHLLGEVGHEAVETNSRGRVMRVLERAEPVPGQNLHLYIDVRLQEAAWNALEGWRAGLVAIDVETGGVLAMVSRPGFDPNPFVTGISQTEYQALLDDIDRPLFDRNLFGQYPPGSTIKPIVALAGLERGTMNRSYRIFDPGFYQLPNHSHKYRDWRRSGHGWVDLHKAIVESCDTYFYDIGVRMGIDHMAHFLTPFGLGERTGIDIPGERRGLMPSREWKAGARGQPWFPGDTVNTSIGQGYMLATPLQLAVATARVASRGEVWKPRIVRPTDWEEVGPESRIHARDEHWDWVLEAMEAVVHSERGTARGIGRNAGYRIGAKTGTAQVVGIAQGERYDASRLAERHRDHALFVGYAPADKPRIAIGLVVENGEGGGSVAAPIARKVMDLFMELYPDAVDELIKSELLEVVQQ